MSGFRTVGRNPRGMTLGAVIDYYQDSPPDAATIAQILAQGDTYELIPRPVVNTPAPMTPVVTPTLLPCQSTYDGPVDPACIQEAIANEQILLSNPAFAAQAQALIAYYQGLLTNPQSPAPTSTGTTPAPSSTPVLNFRNLTHPGQDFQAGDSFQLQITGAKPNQPVAVYAEQNGVPATSPTSMGSTDGSGNFSITGTEASGDVGSWLERWTVAGVEVSGSPLAFTVSAAPAPAAPGKAPVSVAPQTGPAPMPPAAFPSWALWAGAGAALLLFMGASA